MLLTALFFDFRLPQLYYSTSPYLTSQGLMMPQVSPLSPTAASQYLDYTSAAAAAAAYGNSQAAAAYEPMYTAAAYGLLPAGYGSAFGAQSVGASALAAQTAAYQAAAAANLQASDRQ